MKIARIVMEFGARAKDFKGLTDKWERHRTLVLNQEYGRNPDAYRARLEKLARVAKSNGARIALFPACTLVHRTRREFSDLTDAISSVPYVVSGSLFVPKGAGPSRGYTETGVVLKEGEPIASEIDGICTVRLGHSPAIVAISSWVKEVVRDTEAFQDVAVRGTRQRPLLILDMGHHQWVRILWNDRNTSDCRQLTRGHMATRPPRGCL